LRKTLSTLRKEKGLSQAELADDLGISGGAIAMYETGKRTPNLRKALEIAKYFNIPLESISFSNYLGLEDKPIIINLKTPQSERNYKKELILSR